MPWCGKARLTMIRNRLLWSQLCLLACLCDTYGEGANSPYVPGQVLIMPDTTAQKFSDALRSTSQSPSNLTGYTVFDSLSKAHSLQSIDALPMSLRTRALFILGFPDNADIPTIAAAYARVEGIAVAEPDYLLHIAAGTPVIGDAGGRSQGCLRSSSPAKG